MALQQHFNGALTALQRNFNGTLMAQKKLFLVWLMWIIFFMVIYKFEIGMGDPTMWIVDEADCLFKVF